LRFAPSVLDWRQGFSASKVSFPSASADVMKHVNSPYKYCQTIYGIYCANNTYNGTANNTYNITNNINSTTACPIMAHLESHALN